MRDLVIRLFGGLVLAALVAEPAARAQTVDAVEIVEAGTFTGRHERREPSPKTASGAINIVSDRRLIEATDRICARLGVYFGVTFLVKGAPAGSDIVLDLVTRFPEPGVVNAKGVRFSHNEFTSPAIIGARNVRTYSFDEPWELVPGRWIFEFHYKGRKVGETSFQVMTTCETS